MFDHHGCTGLRVSSEHDFHFSSISWVGEEVPAIHESARWFPRNDGAPVDLDAGGASLIDSAAGSGLEDDMCSFAF
jgi:hypothetical protein